ncbi:right-handed parallel beta-helix repeat-containing protein [Aminobacter sp. MDW-2]|uniref:right-handed parallel beta-helix repeat-containing protein n=1 Tax=Aminobacter sp. MDW-2 TaxID=2666139 RepID=UPI0012AEFF73|nr:right-handed parallel beta-helix repeat-containing protein [Aminobacter sp. MDW-2]MRX33229.1 hypothetical protein [Aminobacter sp. MDW-2]QNH36848.1 right-handed parallel beta-helix repeat-containing protein [Aminobacter sp. MDW-2]
MKANDVYRDFVTDGVAASGKHQPKKAEIRELLTGYEATITAFTSNGGLIYDTRANLFADLAHAANTSAWVITDPTVGYNGIYRKVGASGAGSWSRVADLPYSFIRLNDAGAGTANAIVATSSIPLPASSSAALLVMNVFEANTGPVTIAANGAAAKPLKTNSGNDLAANYLTAGMMVSFIDDGTSFRLLSDVASAAIVAAADAARVAAEAAAASIDYLAVADRAALKAVDTSAHTAVFLKELGREGVFVWRSGNFTSLVSADVYEGIYVKADAVASSAGAWVRQRSDLDVWGTWFGAVADGGTIDNQPMIQSALNLIAGTCVRLGAGTWGSNAPMNVPNNGAIKGAGIGSTTIRAKSTGVNLVILNSRSTVSDVTLDGVTVDDVAGGGGVLFQGSYSTAENILSENHGFHGFAYNGGASNRNFQINTHSRNCGHRGTNMSEGSYGNIVDNYTAEDCKRAGLIVGYRSHDNVFTNIWIKNCDNVGLWIHMDCWNNVFTNVVLDTPSAAGKASPQLYVGAHTYDNQFVNFVIRGSSSRGIYLFNSATDHPELGTTDGPTERNIFRGFKIYGDGTANSDGIRLTTTDSQLVRNNVFDEFFIDNHADGVDQSDSGVSGQEYRNFKFGTITNKRFRGGDNSDRYKTAKLVNFEGVTGIGVLTAASNSLDAQPTLPATGVSVNNPYPFPVVIYIGGLAGTANVSINGANVASAPNDLGNGTHILPVGASITLSYTSGSPNWRWWAML